MVRNNKKMVKHLTTQLRYHVKKRYYNQTNLNTKFV